MEREEGKWNGQLPRSTPSIHQAKKGADGRGRAGVCVTPNQTSLALHSPARASTASPWARVHPSR
jgi:hypothetical protein